MILRTNLSFQPVNINLCIGNTTLTKLLLDDQYDTNINAKTESSYTPLQLAVSDCTLDYAKLLVQHGAEVETK